MLNRVLWPHLHLKEEESPKALFLTPCTYLVRSIKAHKCQHPLPAQCWSGGRSWSPPKATFRGICGSALLQAGMGQAGTITDVLCLLWTLCKWAWGGETFFFCLISFVFSSSLTGTCPPPEAEDHVGRAGASCSDDPKSHLLTSIHVRAVNEKRCTCNSHFFSLLFSLSQPKCSFSLLSHVQMLIEAVEVWMKSFSHLTAPEAGLPPSPGIWVTKPLIPLEKCCI